MIFTKASAERRRLDQLLKKQELSIRQAFTAFLKTVKTDDAVLAEINSALAAGNVSAALDIVEVHIVRFSNVLAQVFQSSALEESKEFDEKLGARAIGTSFDPTYPRAVDIMRRNKLEFIQEFSEKQRESTRAALTRAFQTGEGPRQTAKAFVDSIGLTSKQEAAVAKYKDLLVRGSAESLDRGLRDRRFDRTIEASIRNDKPLKPEQIDRMVDRYREQYLSYRSETIARTEGVHVMSQARDEAIRQAIDDNSLSADKVVRIWNTSGDARARDIHVSMDGQEVGLDEPFVDGAGNLLMYPGDPGAPPETSINCRCSFSIRIKHD